ncbi:hypothetical protein H6G81_05980 [Scytonema hofmannii FACHB-248]|uniref:Uncharacterized protein n=1 Tax=Scytonema hofmannii FACHB-248 TaxID=1842502 RepID=A0ABR8GL86_9CYAN|nr:MULTISPECIES: hypothetical protein [Nostocales]MBD2604083.1 hypothetical protein [Scytonema hofmannii FACHB-248]
MPFLLILNQSIKRDRQRQRRSLRAIATPAQFLKFLSSKLFGVFQPSNSRSINRLAGWTTPLSNRQI